jgi:hypothetical protein
MTAPQVSRQDPPLTGDEHSTFEAFLDYHRATLLMKCEGLNARQLKLRSVPPSTLSLLGLIRHMTEVERSWFRRRLGGEAGIARVYGTDLREDADFDDTEDADPAATFEAYSQEVALCRAAASGVSPETVVAGQFSVRWIYAHMLEEYARHNGHADLLRQAIDGATGE